jgi:hypothetical protein
MFEHSSDPLLSRLRFIWRVTRNALGALVIIAGSLVAGMIGYRQFDPMSWTDAFLNASMILSGMGPVGTPNTEAGKIFAGVYALYSGFIVVVAAGLVLAPLLHRMLHRFHLDGEHRKKSVHSTTPSQETLP